MNAAELAVRRVDANFPTEKFDACLRRALPQERWVFLGFEMNWRVIEQARVAAEQSGGKEKTVTS